MVGFFGPKKVNNIDENSISLTTENIFPVLMFISVQTQKKNHFGETYQKFRIVGVLGDKNQVSNIFEYIARIALNKEFDSSPKLSKKNEP